MQKGAFAPVVNDPRTQRAERVFQHHQFETPVAPLAKSLWIKHAALAACVVIGVEVRCHGRFRSAPSCQ
jgi:hypothetical protein